MEDGNGLGSGGRGLVSGLGGAGKAASVSSTHCESRISRMCVEYVQMSRMDTSVMRLQLLRSISRRRGHSLARAEIGASVIRSTPLSLTRRRRGQFLASAMTPRSVICLQPARLIPCNRCADSARPTIAASFTLTTPVRSMATRFGQQGRTRMRASLEIFSQLTRVRRSRRSHRVRRMKISSLREEARERKFKRRTNWAYVKVWSLEHITFTILLRVSNFEKFGLCQSNSTEHSHQVRETRRTL